ncbi:MAG: DUF992 domain-containing protein [Filomicrobium sp.]
MFSVQGLSQVFRVGALALAVAAFGASAQAQTPQLKAGTLTCEGQGTVGLVLGSTEQLDCTYSSAVGGALHRYRGTITRIGIDIGVRSGSVMIWTVLGSTTELPYESLGGNFSGVSADVAAGLGVGANVLIGGNAKSVVLQPLSVKGGTGVSLAAGVAGLNLVPLR